MKYLIIALITLANPSLFAQNNNFYIKVQSGFLLNTQKEGNTNKHDLIIDLSKNLQVNYSFWGFGDYFPDLFPLGSEKKSNHTIINDFGAAIKLVDARSISSKIYIGAGFTQSVFREFENVIQLGENLLGGHNYYYDKKTTITNGIYIKPQLQSRPFKKLETNLYLYANINGYKNIYGGGLSINLFRIRVKKNEESNVF